MHDANPPEVRGGAVLRATALLGLAVNLLVMYPGMMMWDSLDQLLQARDGSLNDWHPPIMSYVWM